jgi:hypothetical protein
VGDSTDQTPVPKGGGAEPPGDAGKGPGTTGPAGGAADKVESVRRSLARTGRPRVGRRFDLVMRYEEAQRHAAPERRRWPGTKPAPPVAVTDEPPAGEAPVDEALHPDELAVLGAGAAAPDRAAPAGQARPWPSGRLAVPVVAVIALVAFCLGAVAGGVAGRSAPPPAVDAAASASTPASISPILAPTSGPPACLETAQLGDRTISLLTAGVRDRRLAEALRRYAAASQRCRGVVETSRR